MALAIDGQVDNIHELKGAQRIVIQTPEVCGVMVARFKGAQCIVQTLKCI